ncbi:MAG: SNF2-related protein [Lysobacterales bacterium]
MAASTGAESREDLLSVVAAALRTRDWTLIFTANALKRAGQMHQSGCVDIESVSRIKRSGAVQIKASVRSQSDRYSRYRTKIELINAVDGPQLDYSCACPVGFACKHAAAVLLEILGPAEDLQDADARTQLPPPLMANTAQRLALIRQLEREAASLGYSVVEVLAMGRSGSAGTPASPAMDIHDVGNLRAWTQWLDRLELPPVEPPENFQELQFRLSCKGRQLQVQTLVRRHDGRGKMPVFAILPNLFGGGADPWKQIAPADKPVLMQVLTCQRAQQYGEERVLQGAHGEQTLSLLLEHGAVLANGLAARPGAARRAAPGWTIRPDGSQQLQAQTDPPAEILAIDQLWYVDTSSGEIGPVEGLTLTDLERVRRAPPLRPAVMRQLGSRLRSLPDLPMPLEIEARPLGTLAGARLKLLKPGVYLSSIDGHFGALSYRYGDIWVDHDDSYAAVSHIEGSVHTCGQRDRPGEASWQQKLRVADLVPVRERFHTPQPWWIPAQAPPTPEGWLNLLEPLHAAGIEVDLGADFPLRLEPEPDEWYADLETTEGSPWFDLELGIRIGEERVSLLPILVQALASRSLAPTPQPNEAADATWLAPIDDQRRVRLPLSKVRALMAPILEWLAQLGTGKALKLPTLRADLLQEYDALALSVRAGETLRRLGSALRSDQSNARLPAPAGLKATLRDYQLDGITWLDFLGRHQLGGLLADDMGLGKTVQVLAHILSERAQGRISAPVLVVMPTSLVPNWQAEAARFAPGLKVLKLHGSARKSEFGHCAEHDLVLTTYALLSRDFENLATMQFDLVVFDEAQALKNPAAKAAQCARHLNARRRLVMTGTPLENHLGELWAQVDLVLPGLLGERRQFTSHFRTPIEKHQDAEAQSRLTRRLRPFLLRRNKQQVALELPPKTEITHHVELQDGQRELYESLRLAMHDKVRQAIKSRGVGQSSIIILDALLKLRQVCCDPRLVKLPAATRVRVSAKRDALMELLEPLLDEGRRVLLFSQFTQMLDLIELELKARSLAFVRLDGNTADRSVPVAAFQSETVPLMLISLKAGGVGLNLTAADTVIHYDPWWNPAVENQATDRAHRIGQDKPVFVYKLVCSDTVEDKIIALQARKSDLASAILDGGSSTQLQFDEQTIEELLGDGI